MRKIESPNSSVAVADPGNEGRPPRDEARAAAAGRADLADVLDVACACFTLPAKGPTAAQLSKQLLKAPALVGVRQSVVAIERVAAVEQVR